MIKVFDDELSHRDLNPGSDRYSLIKEPKSFVLNHLTMGQ